MIAESLFFQPTDQVLPREVHLMQPLGRCTLSLSKLFCRVSTFCIASCHPVIVEPKHSDRCRLHPRLQGATKLWGKVLHILLGKFPVCS